MCPSSPWECQRPEKAANIKHWETDSAQYKIISCKEKDYLEKVKNTIQTEEGGNHHIIPKVNIF